jgi:hypothetical protein
MTFEKKKTAYFARGGCLPLAPWALCRRNRPRRQCPVIGAKQTWPLDALTSENDPSPHHFDLAQASSLPLALVLILRSEPLTAGFLPFGRDERDHAITFR